MRAAFARQTIILDFHNVQGQIAWAISTQATLLA